MHNPTLRKLLTVTGFFSLIVLPVFAQTDEDQKQDLPDPLRWEKQISEFEQRDLENPPPQGAILCIGSSSMRGWHSTLAADLAPLTVIPRGFGGSNMNDVLHYMDRVVFPYKPRAILLYEGDNDIALGMSPEEYLEFFHTFVTRLHSELPQTRVYVLAVKPSIARWDIWPIGLETNRLLAATCEDNELLTYIDVASPLLDENGKPPAELFTDTLHLTRIGYMIWRNAVRPVLIPAETQFEEL